MKNIADLMEKKDLDWEDLEYYLDMFINKRHPQLAEELDVFITECRLKRNRVKVCPRCDYRMTGDEKNCDECPICESEIVIIHI